MGVASPLPEPELRKLVETARAAWPRLELPEPEFAAWLASRVEPGTALSDARAAELFLTCACARGDARAAAALAERYFPDLKAALGRMNLGARLDDVMQALQEQLLLSADDKPPRIAGYTGRGELRAWLRATATRIALKQLRKTHNEILVGDDRLLELPAPQDIELNFLKRTYREPFRAAFREALAQLTPREQNLLRQYFLDGLTIDQLGGLYRVHRATAARWLERTRQNLLDGTRRKFMDAVQLSPRECDSVMRLVRSQLGATLERLLSRPARA